LIFRNLLLLKHKLHPNILQTRDMPKVRPLTHLKPAAAWLSFFSKGSAIIFYSAQYTLSSAAIFHLSYFRETGSGEMI